MAVNVEDAVVVPDIQRNRNFEHRFFITVAVLFPLAVIIGFGPTFYLKPFFNTPDLPSMLVKFHGVVMTAWLALFFVQAYLISSKRIKVHMNLGLLSIAFAIIVFFTGTFTGIAAAKRGAAPPGFDPIPFMIIPLGDMVIFAILFTAAIIYRKKAADHKRLMLLTVLNFLPPALARFPFAAAGTPFFFYGAPDIIAIVLLAIDTYRNGKLNKMFLAGTIVMILGHWLRLVFMGTSTWLSIANWLAS
jgi:hypothetical protein